MFEKLVGFSICSFAKLLTGVRPVWLTDHTDGKPRVYFANHRSHGDFVLIWSCLPPNMRCRTNPVAGADYWNENSLRKYIIHRVFHGLLVERNGANKRGDPVQRMAHALAQGDSLILFPEGTRNMGESLLPFKSGIYHLSQTYPNAEFVPVWVENLGRVMPKGAFVPVPLLCSVVFGKPLKYSIGDSKEHFLELARNALIELSPTSV